jgi:hypothetical protein
VRPGARDEAAGPAAGIRQVADVVADRARLSAGMEVRISLDQSQPPVGRLTVTGMPGHGRPPVAFTGWLGLLHALSDAIDPSGDAGDVPEG